MSHRNDDDRERYFGDAVYDAWRRGLDPDRVTRDRCDDHYYAGDSCESVASELQAQDRRRREQREHEEYQEHLREQEYREQCESEEPT